MMSDARGEQPEDEWAASVVRAWEESDRRTRPAGDLWELAAEAHRQSHRAAEADRKNGDPDFIDSITEPIWDEE